MKEIILAIALTSTALGSTITLTMDEVPTQPIDGLTISNMGESFTFSNPSRTLFYDSFGPGRVTFVQDPSIQGINRNAVFGIAFSTPVTSIQFGLAELFFAPLTPLATVSLFQDSSVPFAVVGFNSSLVDPFTEGQFTFSGALVSNILITPNASGANLAFDNLTVNAIPEPRFPLLAGAVVLLMAIVLNKCGQSAPAYRFRERRFARLESHSLPATETPQFNPKLVGKQAAKREPHCRSLRIPEIVISDAVP